MKYIIYARVSPRGDTETETSIQMQIDFCRNYIGEQKGKVVRVLSDEFFSGKDMNRPAFQQMMAELETGKAEWDCICVYKLSRLSRSLRDGAAIFDKLFQHGKGFVSVTERNLDFSTPAGRAMLGILQVFNQFEREQTVENTRNKMNSIASKGLWPVGHPPFGYRRGAKGDNKLYPDPVKAEIVRQIFEIYASPKYTTADLLRRFPSYSKHTILRILRDQTYLGKICYNGKIYPGQHEPLIDQALFNAAQNARAPKKSAPRPKAQRYQYLLSGLLRCDCGRMLTPASAKSGRYHYYQCTDADHKVRIRAELLENAVIDAIRKKPIPEKIIDRVKEKIIEAKKRATETLLPELTRLTGAIGDLTRRRDQIIETMISLPSSAKPALNDKLTETIQTLTEAQARYEYLQSQTIPDTEIFGIAEKIVSQIRTIQDAFQAADTPLIQHQAAILYIKEIIYQGGKDFKIEFNYTEKEVRLKVNDGVASYILNELFSFVLSVA